MIKVSVKTARTRAVAGCCLLLSWASVHAANPAGSNDVSETRLHVRASMTPSDLPAMTNGGPVRQPENLPHGMTLSDLVDSLPGTALVQPVEHLRDETPESPSDAAGPFPSTNDFQDARDAGKAGKKVALLEQQLKMARYYRAARIPRQASGILVLLLGEDSPEHIQQAALLELALVAQDENDLGRAQQVYAQFLKRWPDDLRVPQVLLQQAMVFRRMGMNNFALTKLYAVMTSALVLKNDQLEYYQRLVLLAQTEIAETHFQNGKYEEAADFFSRLLVQDHPGLNRAQVHFKLIQSIAAVGQHQEVLARAREFIDRYADAGELPEVRFHLARALKALGRNHESLQQVLTLLREQKERPDSNPDLWTYWQRRAGNEIANQLYQEGDYLGALEIYQRLVRLTAAPEWQLPVQYQVGVTYERLMQPELAGETYIAILNRETEIGTNATPGLKAVFDMARWRKDFIGWKDRAGRATEELADANRAAERRETATQ